MVQQENALIVCRDSSTHLYNYYIQVCEYFCRHVVSPEPINETHVMENDEQ